jgi:hypothetical protein
MGDGVESWQQQPNRTTPSGIELAHYFLTWSQSATLPCYEYKYVYLLFWMCISNIYTHPVVTKASQSNANANGSKGVNNACNTDTNKEIKYLLVVCNISDRWHGTTGNLL